MSRVIIIEPMTEAAFAAFGDMMEATGEPDKIINQGLCGRFHDRLTCASHKVVRASFI